MIMDLVWEEMEASVGVMQFMIPDEVRSCAVRPEQSRIAVTSTTLLSQLFGLNSWYDAVASAMR